VARRGLDHDAVVAAAAALADEEGLDAVTLARVAERLGVRPPSLYNHVADRAALLRGIALVGMAELNERLSAAAVGRSGRDALQATAAAYRAYAVTRPGRYEAITRAPDPDDAEALAAGAVVVETIFAVLRAWPIEGDEAIHAARVVRSALHGFAAIERGDGFGIALSVDASFDRLVAALAAGLDAWGEPPTAS
jgi:AcrR family transcriptional regulator